MPRALVLGHANNFTPRQVLALRGFASTSKDRWAIVMPRFSPPAAGSTVGTVRMVLWVFRDAAGVEPRTKVGKPQHEGVGGRDTARGTGRRTRGGSFLVQFHMRFDCTLHNTPLRHKGMAGRRGGLQCGARGWHHRKWRF